MKPKIGGSLIVRSTSQHDIESELDDFKAAGYDFAELFLSSKIMINATFERIIGTIKNMIPIFSVHLPDIEEIERCKRLIEILSDKEINLFVMHLHSPNLPTKENFDLKIETLKLLTNIAKNKNSILALENTEEDVMTLKNVFDQIPEIDFCLDIGHANLFAKENRSIKLIDHFEKLLRHIHVSDNNGGYSEQSDIHLPIGEGTINFKPIFEKLKEIDYSGNINLELYKPDLESRKLSIKRLRELLF